MHLKLTHIELLLKDIITTRGRGFKNAFSNKSNEKIVIFESDDWGSERVQSKNVQKILLEDGIISGNGFYDTDTIENCDDIRTLCEILLSVKDSNGRSPIFTCYSNSANPDYKKIKDHDFSEYFYEPLSKTLDRRGDMKLVKSAWKEGENSGVLAREYHGREHLQPLHWLDLVRTDPIARKAFDLGFYSLKSEKAPNSETGLRASYFFNNLSEIQILGNSIIDGVSVFKNEFGHNPNIICPPNNIFHPKLYPFVKDAGLKGIIRHVRNIEPDGNGGIRKTWGTPGLQKNGLNSFGRNTIFEPLQGWGVDHTLKGISSAFSWNVPAIISTHRVNYIGGIDPRIREAGAYSLKELLDRIIKIWPDVSFMSSLEWLKLLETNHV